MPGYVHIWLHRQVGDSEGSGFLLLSCLEIASHIYPLSPAGQTQPSLGTALVLPVPQNTPLSLSLQ